QSQIAKFASLPTSNEPISSIRLKLAAALTVAAVTASVGLIRICVTASESIIGIDGLGDEPGLKSVATITASPASIMARASGYFFEPSAYTDPGRRTGWMLAFASALIPSAAVCSR